MFFCFLFFFKPYSGILFFFFPENGYITFKWLVPFVITIIIISFFRGNGNGSLYYESRVLLIIVSYPLYHMFNLHSKIPQYWIFFTNKVPFSESYVDHKQW